MRRTDGRGALSLSQRDEGIAAGGLGRVGAVEDRIACDVEGPAKQDARDGVGSCQAKAPKRTRGATGAESCSAVGREVCVGARIATGVRPPDHQPFRAGSLLGVYLRQDEDAGPGRG